MLEMNSNLEAVGNEARLASLHDTLLLGSASGEDFDRFTRLTSKLLRVPVALVSLVDSDHQFFKSCIGLPEPWASQRRTPLTHSFCQYVVATENVLVVEDARVDPILKDSGAVHDLGVVAYLGAPLKRADGHIVGALCAIDSKPRNWSADDIEALSDVAAAVVTVIEGRQIERRAARVEQEFQTAQTEEQMERRLRFVADVMPQIIWTGDAAGNITYFNQRWFDYTGLSFEQTKDWGWGPVLHPDELESCVELWTASLRTGAPYEGEFRFKRGSDQEYRWHLNRAQPRHDGSGTIVEWVGTSTDIHDKKLAEAALERSNQLLEARVQERTAELLREHRFLEAVLDNIADGIVTCDENGSLKVFNRTSQKNHGLSAESLPPEQWASRYSLFKADRTTPLQMEDVPLYRAFHGEIVRDAEFVIAPAGDSPARMLVASGSAFYDSDGKKLGAVIAMHDITERAAAEERFKVLFECSSEAHFLLQHGRVLDCNFAAVALLGLREKTEVLKLHPADFSPEFQPDGRRSAETRRKIDEQVFKNGFQRFEWTLRRADGLDVFVEVSLTPVKLNGSDAIISVCHDLTQRRDAERALAEAKLFAERIADHSSCSIYIRRLDDEAFIYLNRETREFIGPETLQLPKHEFNKRFFHPDDFENVLTARKSIAGMLDGQVLEYTARCRHVTGEWRLLMHRQVVFKRDSDGRPSEMMGTAQDITDLIGVQEELRRAKETAETHYVALERQKILIDTILINVDDGIIASDSDGNITYLNPAVRRMTGVGELPTELTSTWASDNLRLYSPLTNQRLAWEQRPLGRALRGEVVNPIELLIKPASDVTRNVVISARPIIDADGKITGAVAAWHDITEQCRSRRELIAANEAAEQHRKNVEKFQLLVDGAKDYAIFMLDAQGIVQSWNSGAQKLKGYDVTEIIGDHFSRFYPEQDLVDGKPERVLKIAIETGKYEEDGWRVRKDGSQFWANVIIQTMRDQSGQLIGFSKITRDLTDRRKTEAALAAANAQLHLKTKDLEIANRSADAANQAKSDFLANMSHEIRTPMAAILGYSDLMLDSKRGGSAKFNDLQAIRRNGRHLLELISDILDLSKIEAGKMTVEQIPTNLPRLAAESVSMTRPKAIEKGLEIELQFATAIPRIGLTDPLRLRQILVNLIGNAIKFTSAGKITLRVICDSPSPTNTTVRFEVTDTGVGMTEEQQAKLFKPFVQADASVTRQFGGTGLGLTISRQLAKLLGGDITLRSEIDQGSTFVVSVDVGPVAADQMVSDINEAFVANAPATSTGEPKVELKGITVLLAEDGSDNREILSAYLRYAGAAVETVENGRDAVTKAIAATNAGQPYSVVLMDMQMPVLDGYAAASELRRLGYSRPIIALTAHAMFDDRARCLSAGCDDYMSKPVDQHAFLAALARHAGIAASKHIVDVAASPIMERQSIEIQAEDPGSSDTRSIKSSLANNSQLAPVLYGFVARLPLLTDELISLQDLGRAAELSRAAHKLKGAGGSYGLPQISEAAAHLEDLLNAGDAIDKVTSEVQELISIMRRVDGYDHSAEKIAKELPDVI